MNPKKDHLPRYIFIGVLAVISVLVFVARLINIDVTGRAGYSETARNNYRKRTEIIQALRGEIYDRNGKPLVTNDYHYDIYFDYGSFSTLSGREKNDTVLLLSQLAASAGVKDSITSPESPFILISNASGTDVNCEYNPSLMSTVYGSRLKKMLLELTEEEELPEPKEAREILLKRYGLIDSDGNSLYSEKNEEMLLLVRCDMELKNFSYTEPYTFVTDAGMSLITDIGERSLRGVSIMTRVNRVYNYPGYASHILGRTGKIQASKAEYYKELGYSMNAVVGTSGVEEAFEEYLHGTDGEKTIIEDEYGNVIDEYVSKEPIPGKNVFLTIDIDLQVVAEDALAENIALIVASAEETDGEQDGEDASSGAITFIKTDGDILAIASNPTYDLTTFSEDYEKLNSDELSPMFNRALEGTFAPGSTFKPGVAVAALEEGVITPYTMLNCAGTYDYYYESSGFRPACWIYNMFYGRHGNLDVVQAIQDSCNCFFYEVGRQLTIANMNKYCESYGLGETTGIELPEKTGVLAGPEYRDENGLEPWTDGQTVTAAIGQSDNLFTPLQISVYISTLINGGTRYKAHLLHEVKDFYTKNVIYSYEPIVCDGSIKLSDYTVNIVKSGMKNVMENGSAAKVFSDYAIAIGGKTGTAQVRKDQSNNAVFTAFAPYSDPEVVATCVIEHGANGASAGWSVKAVFDKYFGLSEKDPEDGAQTTDEN